MADITLGIDVTISESQRAKLLELVPEETTGQALPGLATGLLQDLADGGMMLSPDIVGRIADVVDELDEESIAAAVEKGVRRFGRTEVVEYSLDPIYVTPLAEYSKQNGRSVAELVQDCMAMCFENEWFYAMPDLEKRPLMLTVDQYRQIAELLGKEVIHGDDIAKYIVGIDIAEPGEDEKVIVLVTAGGGDDDDLPPEIEG